MTDFQKQVYKAVKQIPKGGVATYKKIAKAVGRPKSARAVGNALNKSPGMPEVPCHRIIKSGGKIGGYAGGPQKKKSLLRKEGIEVIGDKINLEKFGSSIQP